MDTTIEERLATLEGQMQGLADHLAEEVHRGGTGYRMEWALIDDATEREWSQIYDWRLDPSHPLHRKVGNGAS